ncbi:hypothetical protein GCM10007962_15450 [Yeosuana aromativorans]|uniref:GH26 domain-containing protein n=1 Tax=Yeosuana aromativorans TaxID=288019 RepID=A0A8J3FFT1_9FLAO|nr:glycosyl hydrolase [Yeosuana aromativorans]GGK22218.1 hypothetical protein GCM10007962_15450 [Yeosuana aromativorans]
MRILFIYFILINLTTFAQQPINPNASAEARSLLSLIANLNSNILSGQHSYNENPTEYYDIATEISGKQPAIWGTDLYWNHLENPSDRVVSEAVKKYNEGAIVTIMWHVGRPMDQAPYGWSTSVQNKISRAEWEALITPGTKIHRQWQNQVDTVAKTLKRLQDLHIPLLWRPYHEMNGVWFWWGNKPGKNGYIKLWKMLYHRLTDVHKINNLIWVWNANSPRDIPYDEAYSYKDYYPGKQYVDILATDVYHFDYEQKDYESLLKLAEGKPIALGEVGQLPKANILEKQPKWSWFMVWANWIQTANSNERVIEIYNRANTLNRNDIKNKS